MHSVVLPRISIEKNKMFPISFFNFLQWDLLTTLMVCSTIFIIVLMLLIFNKKRDLVLHLPPSPPKLPIIGNLHQLGTLPHRSFRDLSAKHGPIMFLQLGKVPTIVVSSAAIAKEIMKERDIEFASRPQLKAALALLYGGNDIGFAPYSQQWRQAKKICVTQLLCFKRVQSFKSLMEKEVSDMIDSIRHRENGIINLGEMVVELGCNMVTRATMGEGYDDVGELAKIVMELIGAFCFADYFPLFGWLDYFTGFDSRLKQTFEKLDAYLDRVINEHNNNPKSDHHNKDFVDTLLSLHKDGTFTLDNVKGIIMDIFLGGTDTTSTTIEWAMVEMMRNQNTMKKVQEEVRRVIGNKGSIDENDIVSMVYLKCVIKETLRLHSPFPLVVPRESPSTSWIKLGRHDIPPKTRVYINGWAIHMDPNIWHEPDQFLPERFLDPDVGNDFTFLPFGSGRRGCPGIQFGMVQVEIALANLLYWFNWNLPPGETIENLDMSETFGIAVHKTKPLRLVPQLYYP